MHKILDTEHRLPGKLHAIFSRVTKAEFLGTHSFNNNSEYVTEEHPLTTLHFL